MSTHSGRDCSGSFGRYIWALFLAMSFGMLGAAGGWLVGYVALGTWFGVDLTRSAGLEPAELAVFFGIVGLGAIAGALLGAGLAYRRRWKTGGHPDLELDYDEPGARRAPADPPV
jgi:hypothetical protein